MVPRLSNRCSLLLFYSTLYLLSSFFFHCLFLLLSFGDLKSSFSKKTLHKTKKRRHSPFKWLVKNAKKITRKKKARKKQFTHTHIIRDSVKHDTRCFFTGNNKNRCRKMRRKKTNLVCNLCIKRT